MDELTVDVSSLQDFRHRAAQPAIETIERLRGSLQDGQVPNDAYTRTDAGKTAHQGHTQNLQDLDRLLGELHALLTDFAQRVQQTATNYQTSEAATAESVRGVQI